MMGILVLIDDDTEVVGLNKKYLEKAGYTVYGTGVPAEGIALVRENKPDCVILDVMMPGMDGYEVCEKIREFSNVPVIFLTGKSSEDDKLKGLMLGGDDYIVKPYSLKELEVRIAVILRRSGRYGEDHYNPDAVRINTRNPEKNSSEGKYPVEKGGREKADTKAKASVRAQMPGSGVRSVGTLVFGKLIIDRLEHKVTYGQTSVELTNREYEAFIYMVENPDRTVTFKELGEKLFGTFMETDRQTIMVIMSRLRKKMKFDESFANMIETVWSKGYKFISGKV